MSEPLTRSLGSFVSRLRLADIPADALSVVHTGFADCVGTLIAGSIEDPPRILQKALAPPPGDATLYLVGPRAPAPEAAWYVMALTHSTKSFLRSPSAWMPARVTLKSRPTNGTVSTSCQPPPSALMRKTLVTRRWPRMPSTSTGTSAHKPRIVSAIR